MHLPGSSLSLWLAGLRPAPPQAAASDDPPQGKANPGDQQKTPRENGEVEQKLLLDLESAWDAFADHADRHRLDREFAAALDAYGVNLQKVEPREAGAHLAGYKSTPQIAAVIDMWSQMRKTRLKVATWRPFSIWPAPQIPIPGQLDP